MTGTAMDKYIKRQLEGIQNEINDNKKEINTKDKDLKDVKALLRIKEKVESTVTSVESVTL